MAAVLPLSSWGSQQFHVFLKINRQRRTPQPWELAAGFFIGNCALML